LAAENIKTKPRQAGFLNAKQSNMAKPTGIFQLTGRHRGEHPYIGGVQRTPAPDENGQEYSEIRYVPTLLPEAVVFGILGLADGPRIQFENIPPNYEIQEEIYREKWDLHGHYLGREKL
jgi:hypothetical protein